MNVSHHLLQPLDDRGAQRIFGVCGDGIDGHAGTVRDCSARELKLRRGNDDADASQVIQASAKAWWAEMRAILRGRRG